MNVSRPVCCETPNSRVMPVKPKCRLFIAVVSKGCRFPHFHISAHFHGSPQFFVCALLKKATFLVSHTPLPPFPRLAKINNVVDDKLDELNKPKVTKTRSVVSGCIVYYSSAGLITGCVVNQTTVVLSIGVYFKHCVQTVSPSLVFWMCVK